LGKVKDATNAYPAAGQWLLQREEYKSWKEGSSTSRLLWLKGTRECFVERCINRLNVLSIAGAGKTVLRYDILHQSSETTDQWEKSYAAARISLLSSMLSSSVKKSPAGAGGFPLQLLNSNSTQKGTRKKTPRFHPFSTFNSAPFSRFQRLGLGNEDISKWVGIAIRYVNQIPW